MVAISFSVFKDKLLDESKEQTIRFVNRSGEFYDGELVDYLRIKVGTPLQIYWKQRQKKVWIYHCPDHCNLTEMCNFKMNPSYPESKEHGGLATSREGYLCPSCGIEMECAAQIEGSQKLFDAVCKDTFLVRLWKAHGKFYLVPVDGDAKGDLRRFRSNSSKWEEDLAKRDGFEDDPALQTKVSKSAWMETDEVLKQTAADKMFEWFDKHHDLSEPKIFQVIRWVVR